MNEHKTKPRNHWVFGYGSLIWRPGFEFVSSHQARLSGAHRSLCVYSHHYRGTPAQPGLVFGLARGGSCHGLAFEVATSQWANVRAYLHEREQVSGVYREVLRPVRLADGTIVAALAYLVDEHHSQYAGRLDVDEQVALVRGASGSMGPNVDYVINTAEHLSQMGIRDRRLHALSSLLGGK